MTKAAAIYQFWASFGLTAYEETNVPSDAKFPYITYQFVSDNYTAPVLMTASLWYRSESLTEINAKAEEIGAFIDNIPHPKKIDGGRIRIMRGFPWSNPQYEPSDDLVQRRTLNIVVEYLTAH